jgi:hypothetical protein
MSLEAIHPFGGDGRAAKGKISQVPSAVLANRLYLTFHGRLPAKMSSRFGVGRRLLEISQSENKVMESGGLGEDATGA